MKEKLQRNREQLLIPVLYLGPVISVIISAVIHKTVAAEILSNLIMCCIATSLFFVFLKMNEGAFLKKLNHPLLFFGTYLFSFIVLGVKPVVPLGSLWMIVLVLAALDSGLEIAVSTHFVFMVAYAVLVLPFDRNLLYFSYYILLGFLVVMLFYLAEEETIFPYLSVILLALSGVMQFVVYRFGMTQIMEHKLQVLSEIVSTFVLLSASMLYFKLIKKNDVSCQSKEIADREMVSETVFEETEEIEEEAAVSEEVQEAETDSIEESKEVSENVKGKTLGSYLEPDFELLVRLKEHSLPLLAHSIHIGTLAGGAAKVLGGNPMIAKVGGLYHEVGRITDSANYVKAGMDLLEQYNFPEEIIDVVSQHSATIALPESIEAAVVLLSDCILTTSDFLKKNGKRDKITDEQLVNSIFRNRIEKGNFSKMQLSAEDMIKLKTYFIENAFHKANS